MLYNINLSSLFTDICFKSNRKVLKLMDIINTTIAVIFGLIAISGKDRFQLFKVFISCVSANWLISKILPNLHYWTVDEYTFPNVHSFLKTPYLVYGLGLVLSIYLVFYWLAPKILNFFVKNKIEQIWTKLAQLIGKSYLRSHLAFSILFMKKLIRLMASNGFIPSSMLKNNILISKDGREFSKSIIADFVFILHLMVCCYVSGVYWNFGFTIFFVCFFMLFVYFLFLQPFFKIVYPYMLQIIKTESDISF